MLIITYCSKTKSKLKWGKPIELYRSQRIKTFFRRFMLYKKAILSYKYGIIFENEKIENYEQSSFTDFEKCVKSLKEKIGEQKVIFYSPRKLVEHPWIQLLDASNVNYEIIRSYKELNVKSLNKWLNDDYSIRQK